MMTIPELENALEAITKEHETHEDFAICRESVSAFGVCIADGLYQE